MDCSEHVECMSPKSQEFRSIMEWYKHFLKEKWSDYTTDVAPNYKTIFFAEHRNRTHRYMLQFILLASIRTIASCDLDHMHCDVRRGVGAQVMRVVDNAHFALNKFESLSIILWYNAPLPLIIFDHVFHTSSTKPNLCTNFSHNQNVHSRLQHSFEKFLNIKTCYSLSHVSRVM